MAAAYDTYDYPSYWVGRDYEHKSEVLAIKSFLNSIKKVKTILEIGAGFGRLVPSYSFRAKKIILSDPSSKLLKIARETYKHNKKNFKFIHSSLENIPQKLRAGSVDLIILVRVIHHLEDIPEAFEIINRTLKPGGYFILEFANKANLKSIIRQFLKGNFTFPLDITRTDLRSKKSIKKRTIPFFNYHPGKIKDVLNEHGFEIVEVRSVSNTRSTFLKRLLSTDTLLDIESILQKLFSFMYLGPSIFVLSQKRG